MTDSPRLRRAVLASFAVLLFTLTVITVIRYVRTTQKPDRNGEFTRTAFLRWRNQVHDLHADIDIYKKHNYPNPPIMALVLTPFMKLPPTEGALAWFGFKVLLAAGMIVWSLRLAAEPGLPYPLYAAMAVVVLSLHPILGDLSHGNVNIYIGALVLGMLECIRRKWDTLAGLVLALAIASKITPMLFVPYFGWKMTWSTFTAMRAKRPLLREAWRSGGAVLAATVVGLALWLVIVPGACLGFERNNELLKSWFTVMAKPFLVDGIVTTEHINQSIPGLVHRLFTAKPSTIAFDDLGQPMPGGFHTIVDLGSAGAKRIVQACQGLWVLGVLLLCRSGWRSGLTFAAECSFVVLGMLLFSERTWKHHATPIVLPFAVIVAAMVKDGSTKRLRYGLAAICGTGLLLMFGPGALPTKLQDDCLAYGSHTAAFLLLLAGVVAVLVSENRKAPASMPGLSQPRSG